MGLPFQFVLEFFYGCDSFFTDVALIGYGFISQQRLVYLLLVKRGYTFTFFFLIITSINPRDK
ncbi:hypothetical protein HanIR_Chr03g0146711 [Helianthus annuus]|nr:hypothetical protein HanIR_Chr03g0146711 [Helianthus annuus]